MFLWLCCYVNDEWGCYIIAPTRGRAKSLFNSYWGNMERAIVSVALCATVVAALWITRAPIVLLCLFWLNVIWKED